MIVPPSQIGSIVSKQSNPIEYASPDLAPTSLYEKGLSNGRMAFLLLLVGYPLLFLPFLGLPILIGSLWLAILAFTRTGRHSVFAWVVLTAFALLGLSLVIALVYCLITRSM
jgi:hypothetical protein